MFLGLEAAVDALAQAALAFEVALEKEDVGELEQNASGAIALEPEPLVDPARQAELAR